MTEHMPRFNPGDNIPVFAEAAVSAGRFIAIVGPKTEQGDYPVEHAAAGASHPFGVAERDSGPATQDSYSVERRINCVRPGAIARVVAGEGLEALDEVAVGTGGKAVAVVAASLATGKVADNNAITFTARESGPGGNSLTVTLVDPGGKEKALSVDVDGNDITVNLATNGTGAGELTSTAAQVIAAIAEHDTASQLVKGANTGASSGAGVVAAVAKASLAGGSGVAVGKFLTDADADEVGECELY